MDTRIQSEATFHDRFFAEHGGERSSASRFYALSDRATEEMVALTQSYGKGRDILEIGCGLGYKTIALAQKGARSVVAIDVAASVIDQARELARSKGLDNIRFQVMNAETMEFASNSFDLIEGWGVLHHLDLAKGLAELARVLRPDGMCVFLEPLGHNPLINLYRRMTPHLRTPDEHPLLMKDLKLFHSYFGQVEAKFYTLTTFAGVPFARWRVFRPLVKGLDRLDHALFKVLPPLQRYAWMVQLKFSQPKK